MAKLGRYSADRKKIEVLTAAKTVSVAECGTIFTLNLAGGFAATLPKVADAGNGWWCKFIVKAAPSGGSYTISGSLGEADTVFHGVSAFSSGSAVNVPLTLADTTNGTGEGIVTITDGLAKQGDQVEIVCDGSNYYVTAMMRHNKAITYD
jgi:hypothetical protein